MDNGRKFVFPIAACCGCRQYKVRAVVLLISFSSLIGCLFLDSKAVPAATLLYPVARSSVDPFIPFSWKPINTATGYYLQVGTAPGLQDVFAVGELPPNVSSWPVDNLLPGTYYARLHTYSAAGEGDQDVSFHTLPQSTPSDQSTFYATVEQQTASVRQSTDALSNVAIAGTALAAELALRHRSMADCTDYAYTLSQLLQQQHIYSRIVTLTFDGTYADGHTIVEYYDPFSQKWSVADPTFGVVYFDDGTQRGQGAAELNHYVVSESWDLIKPKFVTPNGDSYMRNYYLDPITLYLNLVPQGSTPPKSVTHDPKQFLIPFSPGSANTHGYYLFGFGESSGSLQLNNPQGTFTSNSGMIIVKAEDSTVWSRTYALNDNWSMVSAPADAQVYTFRRVLF